MNTPAATSSQNISTDMSEKLSISFNLTADPARIKTNAHGIIPINVPKKKPDHFARNIPAA